MDESNLEDLSNYHRYFAIHCNNELWIRSEQDLSAEERLNLLNIAHASLFHWQEIGTETNIQLANLAVARAYCVNESLHGLQYAERAFDYFDESGEHWVQALTNAILSHALNIHGNFKLAKQKYDHAVSLKPGLSDGDSKVFEATFRLIPVPSA